MKLPINNSALTLLRGLRNASPVARVAFCSEPTPPRQTCLHEVHVAHGGKMVAFAGWRMPIQYADLSVADSAVHTRRHVSLFDVSHMLQSKIYGKDRVAYMESLTPADVEGLKPDQGTLSVFTNDNGGIEDDLIVTKTATDHLYLVTNAGCAEKDIIHLESSGRIWRKEHSDSDLRIHFLHGRGLVALQGPEALQVLQPEVDVDLNQLYFMRSTVANVCGAADCRVTRCGYTGEDGFEISIDAKSASAVVERLLSSGVGKPKLAGLGARDALRLEAGLCLYGNDIDAATSPYEAGLAFVIAKRRRQTGGFPGADTILQQIKEKRATQKRIGLVSEGGRSPRAGARILSKESAAEIGTVTSGCPSPNLKKNIACGYVQWDLAKVGAEVLVDVSGKGDRNVAAKITKMPFVPAKYFTPPKAT